MNILTVKEEITLYLVDPAQAFGGNIAAITEINSATTKYLKKSSGNSCAIDSCTTKTTGIIKPAIINSNTILTPLTIQKTRPTKSIRLYSDRNSYFKRKSRQHLSHSRYPLRRLRQP